MNGMLEEVRVRAVDTAEVEQFGDRHRLLANLNSPSDFEELVALYGHEKI
jgi:hypothetical protein